MIRLMSACTSGVISRPGKLDRMFIGRCWRIAWNPECISALTARAAARIAGSFGQKSKVGNDSARYSQIARLSHTVSSPCFNAGSRPDGEYFSTVSRLVG